MSDHPYLYPGSPAFPTTSDVNRAGLTKREHFAGAIFAAMLPEIMKGGQLGEARYYARDAVACADELVQALNGEDDDEQ